MPQAVRHIRVHLCYGHYAMYAMYVTAEGLIREASMGMPGGGRQIVACVLMG